MRCARIPPCSWQASASASTCASAQRALARGFNARFAPAPESRPPRARRVAAGRPGSGCARGVRGGGGARERDGAGRAALWVGARQGGGGDRGAGYSMGAQACARAAANAVISSIAFSRSCRGVGLAVEGPDAAVPPVVAARGAPLRDQPAPAQVGQAHQE